MSLTVTIPPDPQLVLVRKIASTLRPAAWLLPLAGLTAACSSDVLQSIGTKTEEFTQNKAAAVDILWVVDNSETMAQEQQGLGESFQVFIDTLLASSVNYHIGVTSTDVGDGGRLHTGARNIPVITPDTDNAAVAFLQNVKLDPTGARNETGFETAAMALGKGVHWHPGDAAAPPNAGFLRDEAALFIIFVSDEDDHSFGPVSYYYRLFESYKGPGNDGRVSTSAVVGPADPDNPGCFDQARGAAEPGYRYVDLAGQSGGTFASICSDFNQSLAQLSITAAGLKAIFPLAGLPNTAARIPCEGVASAELCVTVNGVALAKDDSRNGWTYDAGIHAVIFGVNDVPPPEARILVEYQDLLSR